MDGLGTGKYAEEAGDERGRRPCPGAEPFLEHAGADDEREWDETADQVGGGRCPRVWLKEVVVDDVQGDDSKREPSEAGLGA